MQDKTGDEPCLQDAGVGELYVAGVLVHALASHECSIRDSIAAIPGAVVHGGADGKLVVTLEAESTAGLLERLSRIQDLPGVLSALPIYQHNEPAQEIDEEEVYGD